MIAGEFSDLQYTSFIIQGGLDCRWGWQNCVELTNRTLQQGVGGERGRVEFIATTQSCSDINGNPDAFLCAPVFKQRGEKLWRARMEEKGEVQKKRPPRSASPSSFEARDKSQKFTALGRFCLRTRMKPIPLAVHHPHFL